MVIPAPPTAQPPGVKRASRLRSGIVAVVLVAIIVMGIIGYVAAGIAYAAVRIGSADRALNTVVSHQNNLNTTFKEINTELGGLTTSSSFNPLDARSLVDKSVANSQSAGNTINQDDASLADASRHLNDLRWLTTVSQSNLNKESARITHARKALSSARTIAVDRVQDGHFWQSVFDVLADLDTVGSRTSAGDIPAAQTALTSMKAHIEKANQLASAPGLPSELHDLMVEFQTYATDFGKMLDAAQANDDAGVATYETNVQNDATKISNINLDTITTKIDAFYKPLIDAFNSEMSAATA